MLRALGYERLRDRISLEQARDFLENIEAAAIVVSSMPEIDFSSDPDDNIILATAIAGSADLIVSGDKPGPPLSFSNRPLRGRRSGNP